MPGPVKDVDIKLESCEDVSSIQTLISSVKPDWPIDKLQIKVYLLQISFRYSYLMRVLRTLFLPFLLVKNSSQITLSWCVFSDTKLNYTLIAIGRQFICGSLINYILLVKFMPNYVMEYATDTFRAPQLILNYLLILNISGKFLIASVYFSSRFRMIAKKVAALHSLPIDRFAEEHIPDGGFVFDKDPCVLNSALKFVGLISDNLLSKMPINGSSNSG